MPPYSISANRNSLAGNASSALARAAADMLKSLPEHKPLTIGIGGAPGTGKSTLARHLARQHGTAMVLSLDDYYLPQSERMKLARVTHPLLANRGVAGTHDIDLLCRHLSQLIKPCHEALELPVFDKQADDRSARTIRVEAGPCPDLLLVEGWIVGVAPQADAELLEPVNSLEAGQDPDGKWRHWVNDALRHYDETLGRLLDVRWQLIAPDWETIIDWRWDQERQHEHRWLKSRPDVAGFLAPYQRLCEHIQHNADRWSDRVIRLDREHQPINGLQA